jgi:CRP-like cAMP-binding protein
MARFDEGWPDWAQKTVHTRRLAAGQALFRQHDPVHAIFLVLEGRLRLIRHTSEGQTVILHVAKAGESFAEAALFSEVYHCDAVAWQPSLVAVHPKPVVLDLFQKHPEAAAAFMARLARQVQQLRSRLEIRNIRSADERALQFLQLVAPQGSRVAAFDRPLKDVAAEIGLSHEAFYRALAKLERKGLIRRHGRKMELTFRSGDPPP